MSRYAQGTTVAADRSVAEIQRLVSRFGATAFGCAVEGNRALVTFHMKGRVVRIILELPSLTVATLALTPTGRRRSPEAAAQARDQEIRRRWRALVLVIRAKLTAIEDRISTFEREFLADIVVPGAGGQTFGEWAVPQLGAAYEKHQMPALIAGGASRGLPAPGGGRG
jgi:hypothetical protein